MSTSTPRSPWPDRIGEWRENCCAGDARLQRLRGMSADSDRPWLMKGASGPGRACGREKQILTLFSPRRLRSASGSGRGHPLSGTKETWMAVFASGAHPLASAPSWLFVRNSLLWVRSARVTRYVRLFICPSPGESRSSERRSGGNPATRSSSRPWASLPTGRRPLFRAGRPSRDLGLLVVPPLELWLCFRPSAPGRL